MNNKGFGIKEMIFFSLFFISFILIVSILVSKNFKEIAPNKNNKESITYYDLEVKMVNASKKYMNNTYKNIENDIEIPIKLKTLVNSNYLAPVKDIQTKNECNGYVIFIKEDNTVQYKPYLKCDGYKTNGYDGIYD